ncbi:MAG: asparagine synthase (glutamine-hydrolyzing) [Bacteroidetes bacterium]|nr:asparagine synthase (glutamine-hydrolyzing) [Bacteroidota bacterium]
MCGIAGLFSFQKPLDQRIIKDMTDALIHRGPDGEGQWVNPEGTVGLGHRRLSILDLSEAGAQPMHYADGRYTITFNGEIYNYLELKSFLQQKGYSFRSESDTEVLLALYDLKREQALQDLDGMFAFAIWDSREQTLFCARDRFGEKPFFYTLDKTRFAFASEIKALLRMGVDASKNLKKIYNYILFTALDLPNGDTETFFENVLQLEPAHYLVVKKGGAVTKKQYWDLDPEKKTELPEKACLEKYTELLNISIERRLRSDVPVGSSLSGGLDSSSIVMLIDRMKRKDRLQKTFSARFKNFERDEGKYMNLVIEKCQAEPHFVYPDINSAFGNLEKILYHQEGPIGSASILAQYEVMKLARENNIIVLLDGQGADEMMAGYEPYWYTYFLQLYRHNKTKFHEQEKAFFDVHQKKAFTLDREFKTRAYFPNIQRNIGDFQRKFIPASSPYFVGIHEDLVNACKSGLNPIWKFNSLKKNLYYSTMQRGLSDLLRYADRNAMAHSVEVRLPFLYHELAEFVFSVPDDMLMRNGWTKYILRQSMKDILPTEITWRKDKIGYEPPQNQWLNMPEFKSYYQEAVNFLLKEKIIAKEVPSLTWNYITLYAFYNAFS